MDMPRIPLLLVVSLLVIPGSRTLTASPALSSPGAETLPALLIPPDTTTIPSDTLEYPEEEQPYDTLEYVAEGEIEEEESWNLFELPAWVGLGFSGGSCGTGNYESMIGGAVSFGKPMGETGWLELSVGYTATPLQQSSPLRETINNNPGMISMAAGMRAFLASADQAVRPYLLFGLGMDFLLWTYNTPINVAEGEGSVDYVSDDSLPGLDFRLGLGFTMLRESGILISAEVTPGIKLWLDETRNGFTNDLFSSYGFVVLRLQAAFEIGG
jgi:hypothetical protein